MQREHVATIRRPQGKWYIETGDRSGCGGFLNPPTHPMHTTSIIETAFNGTVKSILSLECNEDWVPAGAKRKARAILKAWVPLQADHPDVVAWRARVLGYYRHCYRNPQVPESEQWHAGKVLIISDDPLDTVTRIGIFRDPVRWADEHAGVHWIRKFYPEFVPTSADFATAKWGT